MKTDTNLPASVLTKGQKKTYGPRACPDAGYGPSAMIKATVRYDDQCGNGHNSFAITGEIYIPGKSDCEACGCIHEAIAKYFPELAPFLKWHLVASDGPMHYVANTVYHAGDRDHWGLRKGEFRQHTSRGPHQANGVPGVPCWELEPMPDVGQEPFGTIYSHTKPAPVTRDWVAHGITGEGKARDLDAARRCAVWPDATDEELLRERPELEAALLARLPALLAEFKRDVESLGFVY